MLDLQLNVYATGQLSDQMNSIPMLRSAKETLQSLRIVIETGDLQNCRDFLTENVDLNSGYIDCHDCTPLLHSLYYKQLDIAEHLLLNGARAVSTAHICPRFNPFGMSVFEIAAMENWKDCLQLLLEHGSQEFLEIKKPVHPLHLAILNQATACVDLILDYTKKGSSQSSLFLERWLITEIR